MSKPTSADIVNTIYSVSDANHVSSVMSEVAALALSHLSEQQINDVLEHAKASSELWQEANKS